MREKETESIKSEGVEKIRRLMSKLLDIVKPYLIKTE